MAGRRGCEPDSTKHVNNKVFNPVLMSMIKFSGHLAIHERLVAQTPNTGSIYRNSSAK